MAEAITSAGPVASVATGVSGGSGAGVSPGGAATELGFDQILARLRDVVMRLESGDLSLEQSLLVYEEGVQLARRGQQLLASAERRVEILVSASGGLEIAPFEASDSGGPGAGGAG
jgi:exodeoxyribonuclease VII small subunit